MANQKLWFFQIEKFGEMSLKMLSRMIVECETLWWFVSLCTIFIIRVSDNKNLDTSNFKAPAFDEFVVAWTLTLSKRQIIDSSKLKEFADDNVKFGNNGRKMSKWGENTVRKGEIARNEQFFLFSQCFQKTCR